MGLNVPNLLKFKGSGHGDDLNGSTASLYGATRKNATIEPSYVSADDDRISDVIGRDNYDEESTQPITLPTALKNVFGSIKSCLILVFGLLIPPCISAVGLIHLEDCPAQPYIPLFLVVGGAMCIINTVMIILIRARDSFNRLTTDKKDQALVALSNLMFCITVSWFIAGCTWVYGIYKPSFDYSTDPSRYCHHLLYMFSFWLLTGIGFALAAALFIGLVVLLCGFVTSMIR